MKKIWLMGGFGNVLFQILAYRALEKNGYKVEYVDILVERNIFTKLLGWTIHESIYKDLIDKNEIQSVSYIRVVGLLFLGFLNRKFKFKNNICTFYSDKNRLKMPYSDNNFGYFQDKYFLEENQIELLKLGRELFNKYKKNESEIIVHYRLGDSGWAKEYENYYIKVRNMIMLENETVYIATDSPKEALSFFSDCSNVKLTDSENAMDDFKYMVSASKLYCAPSTFSWWAAHSLSSESQVIMPDFFENKLGIYMNKNRLFLLDSNA
jgi:hypothetical protein